MEKVIFATARMHLLIFFKKTSWQRFIRSSQSRIRGCHFMRLEKVAAFWGSDTSLNFTSWLESQHLAWKCQVTVLTLRIKVFSSWHQPSTFEPSFQPGSGDHICPLWPLLIISDWKQPTAVFYRRLSRSQQLRVPGFCLRCRYFLAHTRSLLLRIQSDEGHPPTDIFVLAYTMHTPLQAPCARDACSTFA